MEEMGRVGAMSLVAWAVTAWLTSLVCVCVCVCVCGGRQGEVDGERWRRQRAPGVWLSGRAFDCRSRGPRFNPGCPLPRFGGACSVRVGG